MKTVNKTMFAATALMLTMAVAAQIALGPVTGDAENGKQLYYDHACFACHAYDGSGRRAMRMSPKRLLVPESRSLTYLANNASGVMINEQVFITFLRARANMNPQFPAQTMPYYPESSLSDDDAKDIYAYIRTFVDDPPEVEDIPALQSILEDAKKE